MCIWQEHPPEVVQWLRQWQPQLPRLFFSSENLGAVGFYRCRHCMQSVLMFVFPDFYCIFTSVFFSFSFFGMQRTSAPGVHIHQPCAISLLMWNGLSKFMATCRFRSPRSLP
mmetsp:Transcript_78200/g.171454  ORF Transcript_78200/g.171454 Transcript_78200/m.171454 type:complete len:112 (-) Transcript_78200:179-514(-)